MPGGALLVRRPDPPRRGPGSPCNPAAALPGGSELPVRFSRPPAAPAGEPLPVVVNFHGGGWVSGNIQQSEWWCSSVAAESGAAVVSVGYRLAPEHPYPSPPEDCFAATVWVAQHGEELGID